MTSFLYKPHSLADAVEKVARQSAGKHWGLYASLLNNWTEIVGIEYAKLTTPVKIAFPYQPGEAIRKNGTLTVRLPKGLAMEFSFKIEIIRQRVNSFFGYEAFGRIALDPCNMAPTRSSPRREISATEREAIDQKVSGIEDCELRKALQTFGVSIHTSPIRG